MASTERHANAWQLQLIKQRQQLRRDGVDVPEDEDEREAMRTLSAEDMPHQPAAEALPIKALHVTAPASKSQRLTIRHPLAGAFVIDVLEWAVNADGAAFFFDPEITMFDLIKDAAYVLTLDGKDYHVIYLGQRFDFDARRALITTMFVPPPPDE